MVETSIPWAALFTAAEAARLAAHAPYSKFRVGAALLCDDGSIRAGCNVENASYGLTVCAERNAVGAMVQGGGKRVLAVAIVVDATQAVPPCGMCRQVLAEFAEGTLPVRSRTVSGLEQQWALCELLPFAFTSSFL